MAMNEENNIESIKSVKIDWQNVRICMNRDNQTRRRLLHSYTITYIYIGVQTQDTIETVIATGFMYQSCFGTEILDYFPAILNYVSI